MFGTNPIRPATHDDGSTLHVKRIFATIQGEGPHAGTPAVFIRLGGCNLACDFCDTDFENFVAMSVSEITTRTEALADKTIKLIIITGGEPLRQNIEPLCAALLARGFTVQLETNGTLWRPLPEAVQVVCSPKNTGAGYAPIRPDVLARAIALKYIVSATHPHYQTVPDFSSNAQGAAALAEGAGGRNPLIYVQPMDEHDSAKNAANMAHAAALAMTHGYKLSLQLHKILGIE